ncbi:UNVERIFIED_CONTAM: hypothetical protein FKN15_052584 [Acipenser sinensis]
MAPILRSLLTFSSATSSSHSSSPVSSVASTIFSPCSCFTPCGRHCMIPLLNTNVTIFASLSETRRGDQVKVLMAASPGMWITAISNLILCVSALYSAHQTAKISSLESNVGETMCSLKFAQRVCKVELGPASRKIESPGSSDFLS